MLTRTFLLTVRKPFALTVNLYSPGSNREKRNAPVAVVAVFSDAPFVALTISTLAEATAPLVASVTLPVTSPVVVVCASVWLKEKPIIRSRAKNFRKRE